MAWSTRCLDVVPRRYLNTGFRVEATGRDAELLRILKQKWGAGLVFKHADSSDPGRIQGQFWAPDFMDSGETYFSIDHVALGCVRRSGVLYRIVAVRGLLPQDMTFMRRATSSSRSSGWSRGSRTT